jgi:dipeptidase E
MKLLLTSGGLTNESISEALFDLVGKKSEETSLVFIPTASNVEMGDKDWLIDDLINLKKRNFKQIDIADISALTENIWKQKFEEADVLFFEGGNTYHLMEWINKSGLVKVLPEYLKTKVYVGLSAGSCVTNKDTMLKRSQILFKDSLDKTEDIKCLNIVDFYFIPHLNSPYFENLDENSIRKVCKEIKDKIYVLDDQSALKIIDEKIEVISEGKWFEIN